MLHQRRYGAVERGQQSVDSCICWVDVWYASFIRVCFLTNTQQVVVIMTCVFVARQDTIFRIAFKATAADVVGGVGESGAVVNGMISMDATTNSIGYVVRTSAAMTGVTAILIRGPVQLGVYLQKNSNLCSLHPSDTTNRAYIYCIVW